MLLWWDNEESRFLLCLKYLHDEVDTSAMRQQSRNRMLCRARPNLLQMTYVLKEKFQQHTDKRLKALGCCSSSLFIWHATQCTTLQVRARDKDRGGGREEVERVERCDNQRLKRDPSAETRTCCLGVLLRRMKSPPHHGTSGYTQEIHHWRIKKRFLSDIRAFVTRREWIHVSKWFWAGTIREHWLRLHGLLYPGYDPGCDHFLGLFTCTHNKLDSHIPVYTISISIPVSNDCVLFSQVPVMFFFFYFCCCRGNNETSVAYCRLNTIKYQHRVADMAPAPYFKQRGEKKSDYRY